MKKGLKQTILSMLITAIVISCVSFIMHGIPLFGLPDKEDIVKVQIINNRLGEEAYIFTEQEQIETARNVANFLNFKLGESSKEEKQMITIQYETENGETVSVSANKTTVWWNGKCYKIKKQEVFVNIIENIFFKDLE